MISEDGELLGPIYTLLNSTTFPYQNSESYQPTVIARADGGWAITYTATPDGDNDWTWSICFDADGSPTEFKFPALPAVESGALQARTNSKYADWAMDRIKPTYYGGNGNLYLGKGPRL